MDRLLFPKPRPARSKKYLAWIRQQPCLVCKKQSQAAHIGRHGMSSKTDDFRCLGLCSRHHVDGGDSLHALNQDRFEDLYALDLRDQIISHLIRYLVEELHQDDSEVV